MGEIQDHEITRKAARVHNDFTIGQPTIDRHNRYRQAILAMEQQLLVSLLHLHAGHALCQRVHGAPLAEFNDPLAEFKVELDKLALALVNNVFIEAPSPSKAPNAHCASPGSCAEDDGEPHFLIPLRSVEGIKWKSGMQRRCMLCSNDTTWVCGKSTTGPLSHPLAALP